MPANPSAAISAAGTRAAAKSAGGAPLSRRRFLATVAGAFALPAAFPALAPARALGRDPVVPAPSNRITLALVGASQGMVNLERCLPFADVQVVAVCEADALRGERAVGRVNQFYAGTGGAGGARLRRDFREMFDRDAPDAAILAAPDHWHGIMAVEALRRGIDVFGEKPLAHTIAEGRAICEAVRRHGRVWQSGSWQRSVPAFRRAAELVRSGALGKVSHAEVGTYGHIPDARPRPADYGRPPATLDYDMWVGPAAWTPYDSRVTHLRWRYVMNYGGGRLIDFVGHHYDIAQWALGLDATGPLSVAGTGEVARVEPYDALADYEYTCEYAGGLTLRVGSKITPGVKFFGERGWLFVGRGRGINAPATLLASSPEILDAPAPAAPVAGIKTVANHWRDFLDSVRSRAETIAPAEAGHRAASVGHLAHTAILTGRKLRWNAATETVAGDPAANALLRPAFRAPWGL